MQPGWHEILNDKSPSSAVSKMSPTPETETPRAAFCERKHCVAGGIGGYHSAVESPERAELGGCEKTAAEGGRGRRLLAFIISCPSAQRLHLCLCAYDSLFPLSQSSPIPPLPSRSSSLAPLSSCFSGFLNCDISAAAPPPSSSSYCSCSSSSSPPRAMCGKSN